LPVLLSTLSQNTNRIFLLKARYIDIEVKNEITYELDTSQKGEVMLIVNFYGHSDCAGLIQFNYD